MRCPFAAPAAVLAAGVALAAAPSPSSAAIRHADPAGAGTACSVVAPCALTTAVGSAMPADEVVLAAGQYPPLTSDLAAVSALDVHGASRSPRAVVTLSGAGRFRLDGDERLSDVDLVTTGSGAAVTINGGATVERVRITATNSGARGAELYTGALLDSTVRAVGASAVAVQTAPNGSTVTATIRNATLV